MFLGAEGVVAGVPCAVEVSPEPSELTARIVTVYCIPFINPEIVKVFVAMPTEVNGPPLTEY